MTDVTAATTHKVLEKWLVGDAMPLVCDLQRSQGHYLHDSRTGKDFLDFFSFFAARPLGFNHPKLKDKAFLERLQAAALHKPSNCDLYTVEYAQFTDLFATVALGGHFRHLFFIEGGSPAVENAVKAAMDWKVRKNLAAGRGEKGTHILHFKQAFHGRTGYCLSLTDSYDIRKTQYFPKFPWPRVSNPKMVFPLNEATKADVIAREAQTLKEIDAAFSTHANEIAAILIEPIQGEGGDNYFRSEFLQALRKVADEREALLIFDEVQTGFGGTGMWWDWQHHNVKPDIIVFGKKTQVCGIAAGTRLDEVDSVFSVRSRISSTFSGNLVDMVRCHRVIQIIQEDDLLTNATAMGAYLLRLLHDAAAAFPEMTAVRGRGLWAAFDMPSTEDRDKLVEACFKEELLILPCGTKTIRMRPALDIDADSVGRAAAQLEAGLRRAFGKKS